jgi:hypothetical protein
MPRYIMPHEVVDAMDGKGTNFTAQLLRLIAKADLSNREKLRLGFPEVVEAYEKWFNG